ncbi:hypothetical protein SGFS_002410 [Streptomyces graminofaciens]|uniref:DUF1254 domain-containing protein n=1 Tax=Streptomyces graminofaciens TaxID=68212 RepID=A0ABN5V7Q5_9ACTN|nr:DUF1254 domain-containing protein [Streptomyces graminofaciens]BBC28950.1 hypothetical protein SGFS_002410 [Streptomyces graminofaciens]
MSVFAKIPPSVTTPDVQETRIGALRFTDGIPDADTCDTVFDNLDLTHGVDAYLAGLPGVSVRAIRQDFLDAGVADNTVLLYSGLMDSASLFLTGNADTVYFLSFLDLTDGPVTLQVPPGCLGTIDDMWFRWVTDFGLPGPDRGVGGTYLLLPPGYDGPEPEGGLFVYRCSTWQAIVLGRAFLEDGDPAPTVARIKETLRISPYTPGSYGTSIGSFLQGSAPLAPITPADPPAFTEGTGLAINTLPPNDYSFYELLDTLVQEQPAESVGLEAGGAFREIGIAHGHDFKPDDRMRRLLKEAVAIGNASARTVGLRARPQEGFSYYANSAWYNPLFIGGYDWTSPPPEITADGVQLDERVSGRALDSRTAFFYIATGDSPAMCMRLTGVGSQYLIVTLDSAGQPFDGARHYRLTLPPGIPAARFWSLTLYDNQTRSMLQTPQRFPWAGSQSYPGPAATANQDGTITLHLAPERPGDAAEGTWIQTTPGKGWFAILRFYSPEQPFFDKTWRPGEVEPAG